MTDRLTILEHASGDGVIVDGDPWSVWQALDDARRSKAKTVALYRGRDRFDVRTDVRWSVKAWGGR